MFHKYKKGFISLFLALSVMLSCCVPVFATIHENFYDTYKTYVYINESVQPYHLALGKGGDFAFRKEDNTYFCGYFADEFFIQSVYRDSSKNITGIKFSFANYTLHKIEVNSDTSFMLYDYYLVENSSTYNYNSKYLYKFDWSKFSVSMSCGIEKGDSFTYLNYQGKEETITFDGQGGIVGYGSSDVPEEDNPFGDLTEEEYPDFSLPEFQGKELSEYVDFDSIIESIKGLDVAGAVQGLLGALKGGFQYVTHSVINIVSHLALTLVSLFDWLKETLPILFGNMVVKLNPYFENLYNALKLIETAIISNPVGEFVFDQEGLFGKLDEMLTTIKNFLTEQIFNALMVIPDIKTAIELWFTAIETSFSDTLTKLSNLYDSLVAFKDNALSSIQNIITDIKNLPDEISDKLFELFVPDDTYLSELKESFNSLAIIDTFTTFINQIKEIILSNVSRSPPVFEFEYMGALCSIDFSFLQKYFLLFSDPVILFFAYFYGLKWLLFSFLNLFSTITADQAHQSDYLRTQEYRDFIRSSYSRRR